MRGNDYDLLLLLRLGGVVITHLHIYLADKQLVKGIDGFKFIRGEVLKEQGVLAETGLTILKYACIWRGGKVVFADELIYICCQFDYIHNLLNKHMRNTLLLVLALLVATYANNCPNCKPSTQIATCTDYHCYRCYENQVLNLDTLLCDCIPNFYRVSGVCAQCPEGYSYDPVTQWCVGDNTCGPNQVLVNGICQCEPGLVVIQNICQRCPDNQTYYPQFDECRCSPGYSLLPNTNDCVLVVCKQNEIYSDSKKACVCNFGYYYINGVCGRCKNNEVYNGQNQSCSPIVNPTCGYNEYFWECCCFCQTGYVRIGGKCVTCPENSAYSWTLDACVCNEGYYFVGEQVLMLPYQSQDTGSSQTSNPGYAYAAYGPSTANGGSVVTSVLTTFSNYDNNNINVNGVNPNNPLLVPSN